MSPKKREMPKFTKAPQALVALFGGAVAGLPDVEARTMFGYPAAFVNGNMFACLFRSSMMLRLSEKERRESGAKQFEPMPGRPMREYVEVPGEVLGSPKLLDAWLRKGHAYAASLPAKRNRKASLRQRRPTRA
jgi:TfoX/Sxy family transcriptional regulator of competence genes